MNYKYVHRVHRLEVMKPKIQSKQTNEQTSTEHKKKCVCFVYLFILWHAQRNNGNKKRNQKKRGKKKQNEIGVFINAV